MAKVNQMTPLSGQPNRFSFHMETNDKDDAGYAQEYNQP